MCRNLLSEKSKVNVYLLADLAMTGYVRFRLELANAQKAMYEEAIGELQPLAPHMDNLRNFLLTTTTEVLSFFQQLREAP